MKASEHAQQLLLKAAEDEFTIDKLIDDPDAPTAVIGFHAQQVAEKILKAVLKARGVRFGRTHNLRRLADLAADAGFPVSDEVTTLSELMPFATEFRYGVFSADVEEPFDRAEARRQLRILRTWAEGIIREARP